MGAIDQCSQKVRASIYPYNKRASEAIEQKSAVDMPFSTLIKLMKVFMDNWFHRKSLHFTDNLNVANQFQEKLRKV